MQAKFKDMPKSMGYVGENLAIKYLIDKGYEILDKNFTVRGGEIDIVARKTGFLFLWKLKRERPTVLGKETKAWIDKEKRILYAAEKYLYTKIKTPDPDFRLDIIEIELDPETGAQKH